MSAHSTLSPSSAHRWIPCPGSMAFLENRIDGGSSKYADDGTASHHWAALCLEHKRDAAEFIDSAALIINGAQYTMDEERAGYIQEYLDDVRRRAAGGMLFVEYEVDLSPHLGSDQKGTADAAIYLPNTEHLILEDLKYGTGEKVYAAPEGSLNPQLGLYALGVVDDLLLLGKKVRKITGVICQPRLGHIDEHTVTLDELYAFRRKAVEAAELTNLIADKDPNSLTVAGYLNPGEKQCRWCRAKASCPALARFVEDQIGADFDTIQAEAPPIAPRDTAILSQAYLAMPLVEDWCRAVSDEMHRLVSEGTQVKGPDGLPYKFVEGKAGKRVWTDAEAAEAALLGQLPLDSVYEPRKIITAPAAAKLLDKKSTKALWKDLFAPMIKQAQGPKILVVGSDPRPPFSGAASADDFEEDLSA